MLGKARALLLKYLYYFINISLIKIQQSYLIYSFQQVQSIMFNKQEATMNTKIFVTSPYSETSKDRGIRMTPNEKQALFNKLVSPRGDEKNKKEFSPFQESSQKYFQSSKYAFLSNNQKMDIENYQTFQQKYERQLTKIKNYYQNQIKNVVSQNKKTQQQLEAKCRGLQKQRNQWKQISIKLKIDLESKAFPMKNNGKQPVLTQQLQQNYIQQENNSLKANKSDDEVSMLRIMNSQIIAQITRLRQENTNIRNQLTKCEDYVKNLEQKRGSKSPIHSRRQRDVSPVNRQNRSTSSAKSSSSHRRPHRDSGSINLEPTRQLQKLRKFCGKLQKVIDERNEQIMKQKTKMLNMKYENL